MAVRYARHEIRCTGLTFCAYLVPKPDSKKISHSVGFGSTYLKNDMEYMQVGSLADFTQV